MQFEPGRARADFPALARDEGPSVWPAGRARARLAYLDNAATTQAPEEVITAVADFTRSGRANVHRGVHALAERATAAYEAARDKVRAFLNAREAREIVFVRGTTEAINLVARTFGAARVGPGDDVIVTIMEHHSNIVPWQMLCGERGANLRVATVTDDGELDLAQVASLFGPRTRLFAVAHVSNAIGTVNPVAALCALAHGRAGGGVPVLVDGAQAAAHAPIDVQALGCDFYAVSGHKVYGPTGIGALYGRGELLDAMPPFMGGGEMVRSVSFAGTSYAEVPQRLEAGTPNIEGAIGFGAAVEYLTRFDRGAIAAHEQRLLRRATERLAAVPGVRIFGRARDKVPIVSFALDGVHPHDLATVLDERGVAIRAGQHCAQPLVERFGVRATARASFALYNADDDVDALVAGVEAAREAFQ